MRKSMMRVKKSMSKMKKSMIRMKSRNRNRMKVKKHVFSALNQQKVEVKEQPTDLFLRLRKEAIDQKKDELANLSDEEKIRKYPNDFYWEYPVSEKQSELE